MSREPDNAEESIDKEMPFLEHLIELRSRILRSLALVALLFIPIYYYAEPLFNFVSAPLVQALPDGSTMIATQVTTPFLTPFKLASLHRDICWCSVFTASTVGIRVPGLYRSEKRFAFPLLLSSVVLFYAGMAFSYFLVFPLVFSFFVAVSPEGVQMMTDINQYLDFVLKMFLAFGIAFEIPVATFLLAWSGLSTADSMANKRPYVIIGCFVAGMLLTPPDVVSQLLLALPTWLLFEFGILMARFVEKRGTSEENEVDL